MEFVGITILAIVTFIVAMALFKILIGGKQRIKENKSNLYSSIGLLILFISLILTMIFN